MQPNYKTKALELFPSLQNEIQQAENTMQLWIEVELELDRAYEKNDRATIENVFKYMKWCFQNIQQLPSNQEDDMYTSIIVTVIEGLPSIKKAWADIPKYFSEKVFRELKEAFIYHISEKEYEEILKLYKKRGPNKFPLFNYPLL